MPNMIDIKCAHCGKAFQKSLGELNAAKKRGVTRISCSTACADKVRVKPRVKTSCYTCGTDIEVLPSIYRSRVYSNENYGFYCSHTCAKVYKLVSEEHKKERKKRIYRNFIRNHPEYYKMKARRQRSKKYGDFSQCKMLLFELQDALKQHSQLN